MYKRKDITCKKNLDKSKRIAICVVYFLILLDTGGANKRTSFILIIVSLLFLSHKYKKGKIYLESKRRMLGESLILISGIITVFVGIDTYESYYGVVRLLAILVTGIAIQQLAEEEKAFLLKGIPYMGIGVFLCSKFQNMSFMQTWIFSTGRVAGTFEYPNTMALFLLIGIVVLENTYGKRKWIFQLILCVGILTTGSRIGFVMMSGYYVFVFFRYHGRNKKLLIIFIVLILSIFLAVHMKIPIAEMGRFLTINVNDSTLQGRFLYWEDACRMICKYPLGLGYMGYFYLQKLMQTGVYSVRFVHNEWLQLMLDYGILAGIGTGIYFVDCFRNKNIQSWKKEVLAVIGLYSFFDFHLQYWSIILIVLLLLPQGERIISATNKKYVVCLTCFIMFISGILFLCTEIADVYARKGNYGEVVLWNPLCTEYKIQQMLRSSDIEEAADYTEDILKNNLYVYSAYLINSNKAIKDGQLQEFIENRKKVLRLRKYDIEEYEEYFQILYDWYLVADKESETDSVMQCIQAMEEIPEMIKEVKKSTSIRALKIKEKPELYLDNKYEKIIQELQRRK